MKAISVFLLGTCLFLSLVGCGDSSGNPYPNAISLPPGTTFICALSDAQQQALLTSPDFNTIGRAKFYQFSGALYCTNGTIFFTSDRETEPTPITPGHYAASETGLLCSFDVAANCSVTNKTF